MLKKKYRLPANIKLEGKGAITTKYFLLKISKNKLSFSRFAFVISKKVSPSAVERNRIKRAATNSINEFMENVEPGSDFLFIFKKEAANNISALGGFIKEQFVKGKFLK